MLQSAPLIAFAVITDTERAKAFYGRILGLPLLSDDQFALTFAEAGTMLRLGKVESFTPAPYTVLGWHVEDIRAVLETLAEQGVAPIRYEGMNQDAEGVCTFPGGALVAWFNDPDGNVLSLAQH